MPAFELSIPNRRYFSTCPELASAIGDDETRLLLTIEYHFKHLKYKRINGKPWIYRSLAELAEDVVGWSKQKVSRVLKKLEQLGLILVGHFPHPKKFDKTHWYTIVKEKVEEILQSAIPRKPAKSDKFHSETHKSRNGTHKFQNGTTIQEDLEEDLYPLTPLKGETFISSEKENLASKNSEEIEKKPPVHPEPGRRSEGTNPRAQRTNQRFLSGRMPAWQEEDERRRLQREYMLKKQQERDEQREKIKLEQEQIEREIAEGKRPPRMSIMEMIRQNKQKLAAEQGGNHEQE